MYCLWVEGAFCRCLSLPAKRCSSSVAVGILTGVTENVPSQPSCPTKLTFSSHTHSFTHSTQEIQLTLSGNHVEKISVFLLQAPSTLLVLGYPWLHQHNLQIDWVRGCVSGWSTWCHKHCLQSDTSSIATSKPVEPLTPPDLYSILAEYPNLANLFSKDLRSQDLRSSISQAL